MMTIEEFEQLIASDPHLSGPLERAARRARRQQFGLVTIRLHAAHQALLAQEGVYAQMWALQQQEDAERDTKETLARVTAG